MNKTFLKSLVTSIQTATTNYFSPSHHSKEQERQSPVPTTPTHAPATRETAPNGMGAARLLIFKDVVYYDASSCLDETHRTILATGGAVEYVPDGDDPQWGKITHVFTNNIDFPGQQDAVKQDTLAIMTVSVPL